MVECIQYRKRKFKYQLEKAAAIQLDYKPDKETSEKDPEPGEGDVDTGANEEDTSATKKKFITYRTDGVIELSVSYAWDGPSGPTVDTKDFMRAALVHDALYQLLRDEQLEYEPWRKRADLELRRLCKVDGMGYLRRSYVYLAVRAFASGSAKKNKKKRKSATAPNGCSPAA